MSKTTKNLSGFELLGNGDVLRKPAELSKKGRVHRIKVGKQFSMEVSRAGEMIDEKRNCRETDLIALFSRSGPFSKVSAAEGFQVVVADKESQYLLLAARKGEQAVVNFSVDGADRQFIYPDGVCQSPAPMESSPVVG